MVDESDVELLFFPTALTPEDVADWKQVVASALRTEPGGVTVVFTADAHGAWQPSRILRTRPRSGADGHAHENGTLRLGERICLALARAGKNVVIAF